MTETPAPSDRFWKSQEVSEDQFLDTVESGDLLLFRGNKTNHKLIRAVGGGEFDHVGMVFKQSGDPRHQVTFVEAVG